MNPDLTWSRYKDHLHQAYFCFYNTEKCGQEWALMESHKRSFKSKATRITMVYFFHAFNDLFKVARSTFTFARDLSAYIASIYV